jgi:uncharacterized membrane protein YeaQ/YmgE (transglycosylase-associated protein family)
VTEAHESGTQEKRKESLENGAELYARRRRDSVEPTNNPHCVPACGPDNLLVDSNFEGGNIMLHLLWYVIVGLIAGWAAKSIMHMHMSLMWTIILGIVGSVVGGLVTHIFSRPKEGAQFHPAGLIVSFLGALLVLWLWHHFKLHIPTG